MEDTFKEYLERYNDPKYIFVSAGIHMIVGEFLEKTKVRNNHCDSMKIVDILYKLDIFTKVKKIKYYKVIYEINDIIEKHIYFETDPIDAYYDSISYAYKAADQTDPTRMLVYVNNKTSIIQHHTRDVISIKKVNDPRAIIYDEKTKHRGIKLGIPYGITHVYDCVFINKTMPETVRSISFVDEFDGDISDLPDHIEHIALNFCYDTPIVKLPKSLKTLAIGSDFNKKIHHFPQGLIKLEIFSPLFSQSLENLPTSLLQLELGSSYNQASFLITNKDSNEGYYNPVTIPNPERTIILPKSLEYISINEDYEKLLDVLPGYEEM